MGHKITVGNLTSDGKMEDMKAVPQEKLTAECWLVQLFGTDRCKDCEARGTEDCGGKKIRRTGKNEKGFRVGKTGLV